MDCREVRRRIQHFDISREREPARRWLPLAEKTHFQLHPLVVPQDSQTKQEPAGRMRTPQVEQKGASTAAIPGVNASPLRGEPGPTVAGAAATVWEVPASLAAAGSPASAGAAGGSGGSAPGPRAPVAAGAGCGAAGAAPVAVGPLPLASSIRSAVVLIPSACLVSTSRWSMARRRAM